MPRPAPAKPRAPAKQAVIYVRVSTDRQAQEGVSLDAQEAACRAHAARLGLEVVAVESDPGFSGRLGHNARPGLARVLAAVRANPETAVVVYSLSRLGRSQRAVAELLAEDGPYRLRLVSVTEPIDMTTAMGRAIAGVITAFAQLESDLASERTTAALAYARTKGVRLGAPPCPPELVARVRETAAAMPGASARAVAEHLNAAGVPSARGRAWHAKTVTRALNA
ncbi:MAG TPA: recombinase family protein [Polyangiaceae bacterium]|nr:recombinase family protein [Polyangiaceae bacterium]